MLEGARQLRKPQDQTAPQAQRAPVDDAVAPIIQVHLMITVHGLLIGRAPKQPDLS